MYNVQKPTFDEEAAERRNADEDVDYNDRVVVKRPSDAVAGQSLRADFSKRRFDKIEGYSSLGGLQKRAFDRIGDMSSLGGLSKKASSSSSSSEEEDREMRLLMNRLRQRIREGQFDREFDGPNSK